MNTASPQKRNARSDGPLIREGSVILDVSRIGKPSQARSVHLWATWITRSENRHFENGIPFLSRSQT